MEGFVVGDALGGGGEEGVGELSFFELELVDAVFDGGGAEEFVDEDGFVLADAVGAVGGLVFSSWVPPGVVVDDGVGASEVEAGASGFEGDEEDGDVGGLEVFDEFAAVFGGAGEFEVGDVEAVELLFDEGEHGGELGEEEDAAFFLEEGVEKVEEVGEFGRVGEAEGVAVEGDFVVVEETRVAADLAEFEEGVEDGDFRLGDAASGDGVADAFVHGGADGFVEVFLVGGQLDGVNEGGFGWKVFGDFVFGAAEDEGGETRLESGA